MSILFFFGTEDLFQVVPFSTLEAKLNFNYMLILKV